MRRIHRGGGLLAATALLLTVSFPASAGYLYTISYAELTFNGLTYVADMFSFTVDNIITETGFLNVSVPGGELNGFTFTSLTTWCVTSPDCARAFDILPSGSRGIGAVNGLYFSVLTNPNAVGTYPSTGYAGRGIEDAGGIPYRYVDGSLTIAELPGPAVPEPGSGVLILSAACALFVGRKVQRRRAPRASPTL
jgi:hypothetical protein